MDYYSAARCHLVSSTDVDTHHATDVFPVECLRPGPGLVVVVDCQRGVTTRQFVCNSVHCRAGNKRLAGGTQDNTISCYLMSGCGGLFEVSLASIR